MEQFHPANSTNRSHWKRASAVLSAFALALLGGGALFSMMTHAAAAQTPVGAADVSALRINEFMARNDASLLDPADPDPQAGCDDWLEIYNPGPEPVEMNGLYLTDSLDELTKHPITQSVVVPARGYLLLWADGEPEQGPTHLSFRLNGDGEALVLVAADGATVIDSYIFGPQDPDVSEGRLPDGSPNWVRFPTAATPGSPNLIAPRIYQVRHQPPLPQPGAPVTITALITDDDAVAGATLFYSATATSAWTPLPMMADTAADAAPDRFAVQLPGQPADTRVQYYIVATGSDGESVSFPAQAPAQSRSYLVGYQPPPLYINEFMADNGSTLVDSDEEDEFPDWFELYNAGDEPISLDGFFLTDDLDNPTRFAITAGLTIAPGAFRLFYADDDPSQGTTHTNFRLDNGGETIALLGPYGAAPIDVIEYGAQRQDRSTGRFPDGAETLEQSLCATPGAPNILCEKGVYMPLALNNAAAGDASGRVRRSRDADR